MWVEWEGVILASSPPRTLVPSPPRPLTSSPPNRKGLTWIELPTFFVFNLLPGFLLLLLDIFYNSCKKIKWRKNGEKKRTPYLVIR